MDELGDHQIIEAVELHRDKDPEYFTNRDDVRSRYTWNDLALWKLISVWFHVTYVSNI